MRRFAQTCGLGRPATSLLLLFPCRPGAAGIGCRRVRQCQLGRHSGFVLIPGWKRRGPTLAVGGWAGHLVWLLLPCSVRAPGTSAAALGPA